MLFNSYIFIFIFLPLAIAGYFLLNHFDKHELSKLFLSCMSLWFYAYFNLSYLAIILSSIIVNYGLSFIISKLEAKNRFSSKTTQRIFLLTGLALNLGLFIYYKYWDFLIENINLMLKTDFRLHHILLPLGISFFTFQQLSFVIDRCKGNAKHYSFINYITFVTFFPQLIAGPIVLYDEMMPQFEDVQNKHFNSDNFSRGLMIFSMGLAKKVLLADVLATVVNFGYDNIYLLDSISALIVGLSYVVQTYFDFSGYSEMAIGIGKMFNINLPVNFDSPFKACTIKETWQRWHITLSRFFIKYVYIPLGGSRKGKLRTYFNIFLIFFLSGIWHGANWTFVIWGTINGLLVVWDNLNLVGIKGSKYKAQPKIMLPRFVGWFLTFMVFGLSTIFIRSNNIKDALFMFKNIFSFKITGYFPKLAAALDFPELYLLTKAVSMKLPQYSGAVTIGIFILFYLIVALILCGKNTLERCTTCKLTNKVAFGTALLLVWSIISFSQVSTFIYFNF